MNNRLHRFHQARTFVLGTAVLTLLGLPGSMRAQSTAPQDRQAFPGDRQAPGGDDVTRRDLAQFDQFLDGHREIAEQVRKTPSLVDDPQYLNSHPELNAYLQEHGSVKQEISQQPDTFMRLEDIYGRDRSQRDRDAVGPDRDANRRGVQDNDRRDNDGRSMQDNDRRSMQDNDQRGRQDVDQRGRQDFDRFLDQHREIGEQVRKNPSLLDDRNFIASHPELQSYLAQNPGVRDDLRNNPGGYMQRPNFNGNDSGMRDRDNNAQFRDNDRRDTEGFDRFLDQHHEIGEQVRKNPSLLDDRRFVESHPELQSYLQQNPGVRDQLRQNANGFMQQAEAGNRDRDGMHGHMEDFGGFLGNHNDIRQDLSKDPNVVKDHKYMEHHGELNAYLNAHPDVRAELMADPQSFVKGAQQYKAPGASGDAGTSGRGAGTTGTPTGSSTGMPPTTHNPTGTPSGNPTGTPTTPPATTHTGKPNQ